MYVSGGAGTESLVTYDHQGRIFIDRDPTHFRWLLNYLRYFGKHHTQTNILRDGYLVTIPSQVQHRLEILHEARYYRLDGLASIIASPAQYQQPHPYVTQQMAAQAMAANAAAMQAQAQAQRALQSEQEKPSFMNVRPSTRGLFYLCDSKWSSIVPEKPSWNIIAVNFEDASDEVVFWSISVSFQQDPATGHIIPSLGSKQELCRAKLDVGLSAKVCSLPVGVLT